MACVTSCTTSDVAVTAPPVAAPVNYKWTPVGVGATAEFASALGNPEAGDAVTEAQMDMIVGAGQWEALLAAGGFVAVDGSGDGSGDGVDPASCTAPSDTSDMDANVEYIACLRTDKCVDSDASFNGKILGIPMAATCPMALTVLGADPCPKNFVVAAVASTQLSGLKPTGLAAIQGNVDANGWTVMDLCCELCKGTPKSDGSGDGSD